MPIVFVLVLLPAFVAATLPLGPAMVQSASNSALHLRHCNFQAFAVSGYPGDAQDFNFTLIPALNGQANAVSFRSMNYPDHILAPCNDSTTVNSGVEANRLCILQIGTFPVDDGCFVVVAGLSDASLYSFQSMSTGGFGGSYIALNGQQSGGCAPYPSPASDVVLTSNPSAAVATWSLITPPPLVVNVDATQPSHTINKLYLGCHSDSGYTHQPRGYYSQMIYGEVFEFGVWPNNVTDGTVVGMHGLDGSATFQGLESLKLVYESGDGLYGIANRGLGNEGLFLEANKEYEGYFFALGQPGSSVDVTVQFRDTTSNAVLASQTVTVVTPSGTIGSDIDSWIMVNFTLTPSAGTECVGITPGSDPTVDCGNMGPQPGHICVKCGGQFEIGLTAPSQINIDYVFLQPGQWGRLPGLSVLSGPAQWLVDMGITAIRQGGTFTQGAYYEWKNWRGPAWLRPSLGAQWGASLISGWGPFEMIDMCNALGFQPIITTSMLSSAQDFADLVEYMYGNSSTEWGAARYRDGHPMPYQATFFELGNEQYNPNYVEQVAAMEAVAAEVGMPKTFYYMFPNNPGPNAQDAAKAQALGLGDHVVTDIHVGAGGGIEAAEALFASNPAYSQGAVNCETNPSTHDFTRAIQEAMDLNDFFNTDLPRMHARTASFCTERSGHYDAFDQGLVFFLPNMTWGQPPFYVHSMIKNAFFENALTVTSPTTDPTQLKQIVSASMANDGMLMSLFVVNQYPTTMTANVTVTGAKLTGASVTRVCLQSDDMSAANTPAFPTAVSPGAPTKFVWDGQLTLPPQAYCTFSVQL